MTRATSTCPEDHHVVSAAAKFTISYTSSSLLANRTTSSLVMDPSDSPPLCKWCVESSSEVFENARLCRPCYHKAILASQNPQLCEHCSVLLTDKEVSRALFSEDGWAHGTDLKWSSENGCGLCRMFLLQDPNPDRMTFRIGWFFMQRVGRMEKTLRKISTACIFHRKMTFLDLHWLCLLLQVRIDAQSPKP